jgi:hypothetical protein
MCYVKKGRGLQTRNPKWTNVENGLHEPQSMLDAPDQAGTPTRLHNWFPQTLKRCVDVNYGQTLYGSLVLALAMALTIKPEPSEPLRCTALPLKIQVNHQ